MNLKLIGAILSIWTIGTSFGNLPAHFMTKLYTEAMGRAPDQGGYRAWINFIGPSVNQSGLQTAANAFFTSAEFQSLGYTAGQQVQAVYRALLSRDPESNAAINAWANFLNANGITAMISEIIASGEFQASILNQAFSGQTLRWRSWTAPPSLAISSAPDAGCSHTLAFSANQNEIQTRLNAAQTQLPNRTVCMNIGQVISLSSSLTIPENVTLRTVGNPATGAYARFGRLVRANVTGTDWAMVEMGNGSRLRNVFVDGQESVLGDRVGDGTNGIYSNDVGILINGRSNVSVEKCRVSDAPAWTHIRIVGAGSNVSITENLITAYYCQHSIPPISDLYHSDGISLEHNNVTVRWNHIIDASDVGIVVFRNETNPQTSFINSNVIVNTGMSANSAIVADAINAGAAEFNYTGCVISNNLFWAGPDNHYDIMLSVNTRPWWGNNIRSIRGIRVESNTSGTETSVCNVGIFVGDLIDGTVQNNGLMTSLQNTVDLPVVNILGAQGTVVGGTMQGPPDYRDVNLINGEVSHWN